MKAPVENGMILEFIQILQPIEYCTVLSLSRYKPARLCALRAVSLTPYNSSKVAQRAAAIAFTDVCASPRLEPLPSRVSCFLGAGEHD